MPRPLNRNQILQNRAFLRALRRTGNVRLAAREVGIHRATLIKRRARHPAFAADWDAALALAHAALDARPPDGQADPRPRTARGGAGEPRPTRLANGRLQLRAPARRRLTPAAEQAFLAALSATANVRLSARAAGFSHSAFYQRRRESPSFAREMRLALEMGYERLEMALLAGFEPEAHSDDAWRHNEPPAIPPMTPAQALQLMYLHQKEARLWTTPVPDRLRPGETWEARSVILGMIHEARTEREREKFRIAEADRRARGEPTLEDFLIGPLPDLAQVTGWSKAKPRKAEGDADPERRAGVGRGGAYDEGRALFGGWRVKGAGED